MTLRFKSILSWGLQLFVILFACAHKPLTKSITQDSPTTPLYRLGYGDVIEVKFFDNDRFSRQVTVRPDGRIVLEKIGDIHVSGLTTDQLDSIITHKYRNILKAPDVTIFVNHYGTQKVYVLGEVNKPGGYLLEREMTVTHAIVMAGGLKRSAKKNSVLLIRKSLDGQLHAERVNVKKILSINPGRSDKQVQSLDIIYVPKTCIANIDSFLDQFFDIITPPVDVFWRIWFMEQINSDN